MSKVLADMKNRVGLFKDQRQKVGSLTRGMLERSTLSTGARLCWGVLDSCAEGPFPELAELAFLLGLRPKSKNSVRRYLAELESEGGLVSRWNAAKAGWDYILTVPDWWLIQSLTVAAAALQEAARTPYKPRKTFKGHFRPKTLESRLQRLRSVRSSLHTTKPVCAGDESFVQARPSTPPCSDEHPPGAPASTPPCSDEHPPGAPASTPPCSDEHPPGAPASTPPCSDEHRIDKILDLDLDSKIKTERADNGPLPTAALLRFKNLIPETGVPHWEIWPALAEKATGRLWQWTHFELAAAGGIECLLGSGRLHYLPAIWENFSESKWARGRGLQLKDCLDHINEYMPDRAQRQRLDRIADALDPAGTQALSDEDQAAAALYEKFRAERMRALV